LDVVTKYATIEYIIKSQDSSAYNVHTFEQQRSRICK